MSTKANATIEDLYRVPDNGKAEIVNGEVVLMSPTGAAPNFAAGEIFASLREFSRRTKSGRAVTDNAGFKVSLPHRGKANRNISPTSQIESKYRSSPGRP